MTARAEVDEIEDADVFVFDARGRLDAPAETVRSHELRIGEFLFGKRSQHFVEFFLLRGYLTARRIVAAARRRAAAQSRSEQRRKN